MGTHNALVIATAIAASALASASGCASVSTVRLQPEAVTVGPGLEPVAAIQANASSAYVLFIPLPGGVNLDRVINRMLVATAKDMGADKIAQLRFEVTPDSGIWKLRRLLGWRSAMASGIAVRIVDGAGGPEDPYADEGPEPAGASSGEGSERGEGGGEDGEDGGGTP